MSCEAPYQVTIRSCVAGKDEAGGMSKVPFRHTGEEGVVKGGERFVRG